MFDFPLKFNFTLQFLNLTNLRMCLACMYVLLRTLRAMVQSAFLFQSIFKPNDYICLFFFHQAVVYMLKHIASSNGGAIITGLLCLAILIGLKKVNERFKSKLPVPIPAELLVVMLSF